MDGLHAHSYYHVCPKKAGTGNRRRAHRGTSRRQHENRSIPIRGAPRGNAAPPGHCHGAEMGPAPRPRRSSFGMCRHCTVAQCRGKGRKARLSECGRSPGEGPPPRPMCHFIILMPGELSNWDVNDHIFLYLYCIVIRDAHSVLTSEG